MSVHIPHLDSHEFGLADDCPRCAEHAQHPFEGLDSRNLAALAQRIEGDKEPRSKNERTAMHLIRGVMDRTVALKQVGWTA